MPSRAPKLIDTHTHVNFNAFKDDGPATVERSLDAGTWLVNVGSQMSTSERAVEYAAKYKEGVFAAVGLHPNHLHPIHIDASELGEEVGYESEGEWFNFEKYKKLAAHPKVVAIGESGLDYFRIKEVSAKLGLSEEKIKGRQRENFLQHVHMAKTVSKPFIIHCRDAHADLVAFLTDAKFELPSLRAKGVIHCFTGTLAEATKYVDLGFYIGFTGIITFARTYDDVVKNLPLDRILVETDAPYLSPAPYRGKRNEPAYVGFVAEKIAELRGISADEVAHATTANARKLFGI